MGVTLNRRRMFASALPLRRPTCSRRSILLAAARCWRRWASRPTARTFIRAWATHELSDLKLIRGQLAQSERFDADARAQDSARGAPLPSLDRDVRTVWLDTWFREQHARGIARLDSALAKAPLRSLTGDEVLLYLRAAELYAIAGRPDRARAVLAQWMTEVRDSARVNQSEPVRHDVLAEVALAEHRPLDALKEFALGDRLPDGPVNSCATCIDARLGRAYDLANMPDSTIALYERYLAVPGTVKGTISPSTPIFSFDALYRAGLQKRLGELYEEKGDREKAMRHYAQFLEQWKNADPELQPKVEQVRTRLAHLQSLERR